MNAFTTDWGKAATILGVAGMVVSVIKDAFAEKTKNRELEERVKNLEMTITMQAQQMQQMQLGLMPPTSKTKKRA